MDKRDGLFLEPYHITVRLGKQKLNNELMVEANKAASDYK